MPDLGEYQTQFLQLPADWRLGLSKLFDDLEFEDKIIKYAALGVDYYNNIWIQKSELAIYDVHCCLISDLGYGYISLGYESGKFTLYVTFAAITPMYDERQLEPPNYAAIPEPAYQQFVIGFQCEGLSHSSLSTLCNTLLHCLEEPIEIRRDLQVSISASIGVVVVDESHQSVEYWNAIADKAMYDVKNQGRANYLIC